MKGHICMHIQQTHMQMGRQTRRHACRHTCALNATYPLGIRSVARPAPATPAASATSASAATPAATALDPILVGGFLLQASRGDGEIRGGRITGKKG